MLLKNEKDTFFRRLKDFYFLLIRWAILFFFVAAGTNLKQGENVDLMNLMKLWYHLHGWLYLRLLYKNYKMKKIIYAQEAPIFKTVGLKYCSWNFLIAFILFFWHVGAMAGVGFFSIAANYVLGFQFSPLHHVIAGQIVGLHFWGFIYWWYANEKKKLGKLLANNESQENDAPQATENKGA